MSVNLTKRLNNPGHIEIGAPWEGLAPVQKHPRFATFIDAPHGIRAIARVLITYQDKRTARDGSRIDTVREIIERWAPPSENDSTSYATHVRKRMGLDHDDEIDVKDFNTMRGLVLGIIQHENGCQPYSEEEIRMGLALAGIKPPLPPVEQSRTLKAGTVAAVTTGVGLIAEPVRQLAEQVETIAPAVQMVREWVPGWILGAIALLAIGYMAFRYIQDRKLRVA